MSTALEVVAGDGVTLRGRLHGQAHGERPLCILVHGWPELGLSWRHQIAPLVEAGYRVAVPDVRGYGASGAPNDVSAYGIETLTDDVVSIIDALGYDDAVLIGHDWGAPIVWNTALLHPDRVSAVVGMSVPYFGVSGGPPTEMLRAVYKDRFFYILYLQQPDIPEAEFEANARDALLTVYFVNSGDSTKAARAAMRARTPDSGYLDGLPLPEQLPDWLSNEDLDAYAAAYESSGFHGGFHRYRNMDNDWRALQHLKGKAISQPAMFLAGEHDSVLRYAPGINMMDIIDPFYDDLRGKFIIEGAGHWVQQEQPDAVNQRLLAFLRDAAPSHAAAKD